VAVFWLTCGRRREIVGRQPRMWPLWTWRYGCVIGDGRWGSSAVGLLEVLEDIWHAHWGWRRVWSESSKSPALKARWSVGNTIISTLDMFKGDREIMLSRDGHHPPHEIKNLNVDRAQFFPGMRGPLIITVKHDFSLDEIFPPNKKAND
jgi:hypothetical protein